VSFHLLWAVYGFSVPLKTTEKQNHSWGCAGDDQQQYDGDGRITAVTPQLD
jgi:hypothetical protein